MPASINSTEDRPPSNKAIENADVEAIDSTIDHMRAFLPEEPYVLTIPQDVGDRYQHAYRAQASQWLYNAPFSSREWEGLQYQTFEYHEPLKTIYLQRTHAELDRSERQREGRTPATGASTPVAGAGGNSTGPKKVLSFSAYKQKKEGTPLPNGSGVTSGATAEDLKKREAVKGPVERVKAETAEVLAAAKEAEEENAGVQVDGKGAGREKQSDVKELKRKRQAEDERVMQDKSEKRKIAPERKEQPPMKKARNSPDRSSERNQRKASPLRSPDPLSLPPRPISPLGEKDAHEQQLSLPPPLSPLHNDELPPRRLTPSLPTTIRSALEEKRASSSSAENSAPNSISKERGRIERESNDANMLTPTKSSRDTQRKRSPVPKNGYRASSNSPATHPAQASKRKASPPSKDLSRQNEKEVGKTSKKRQASPAAAAGATKKGSLILKLKFKKARRADIQRILKMRPRPLKQQHHPTATDDADEAGKADRDSVSGKKGGDKHQATGNKGVAKKVEQAPAKKRPPGEAKEEPSTISTKRKKPAEVDDIEDDAAARPTAAKKRKPDPRKSSSPMQDRHSPPARHYKASASSQTTPSVRKDFLHASAHKDSKDRLSADHLQNTPTSSTPSASAMERAPSASSAGARPLTAEKTPLQRAWEKEQARLQTLGRELKHLAQDCARTAQSSSSSASKQSFSNSDNNKQLHSALASLEAYLTFILSFHCADMASACASPRLPPVFKNWFTLDSFLSFVKGHCRAFPALELITLNMGIVSLARMMETAGLVSEKNGPNFDQLLGIQRRLFAIERERESKGGGVDGLMGHDWRTLWEGRDRSGGAMRKEDEDGKPGEYRGVYRLPVGMQSSPLVAVRVGVAMLKEWSEREKKDGGVRAREAVEGYEFKLKL